jgi:Phytanoyl-CoA dioxygenase (PhyH)
MRRQVEPQSMTEGKLVDQLANEGFALRRGVLSGSDLAALGALIDPARRAAHATRNLLWDVEALPDALARCGLDALAAEALGAAAFPINVLYFDKTADANWKVPAHQDLMMPVADEVAEPGFSGWGRKAGIPHVEPPTEALAQLVALRVHFDDTPADNGALAVIPHSHQCGKLRDLDLAALDPAAFTLCEAAAGDVLLMKPLVVHRSSPARDPAHRRVLHVVYACAEPGVSVRWKCPTRPRS